MRFTDRRSLAGPRLSRRGSTIAAYRVPAASLLLAFSLARHSHGATGALSAHRPRRAARARSRNTTGQSTLRCPAQREITNAASECARKATCGAVRIRQGIISGMAAIKLTLTS